MVGIGESHHVLLERHVYQIKAFADLHVIVALFVLLEEAGALLFEFVGGLQVGKDEALSESDPGHWESVQID